MSDNKRPMLKQVVTLSDHNYNQNIFAIARDLVPDILSDIHTLMSELDHMKIDHSGYQDRLRELDLLFDDIDIACEVAAGLVEVVENIRKMRFKYMRKRTDEGLDNTMPMTSENALIS